MRLKKKGALELSINAIVIVVLAMTLLGLGLGFVRNMITGIGETTGSVQEQVKQQILDDLRRGDKKLSFPSTEVKTEIAGEEVFAVGIKNTGDTALEFEIELYGLVEGSEDPMISTSLRDDDKGSFFFDASTQTLQATEANVYAIKYFAPTTSGTYMYKMKVCKITEESTTTGCDEYTSKTFFVNVR